MTDVTSEPTVQERNLRFVLLKAIIDSATKELGGIRDENFGVLLARYKAEDTTEYKVKLPGTGNIVATVKLPLPKREMTVTDQEALLKWARVNYPSAVGSEEVEAIPEETRIIPAVPARTEYWIEPRKWAELEKFFEAQPDGTVADTSTGAVVDGMAMPDQADPKSFSVTYPSGGVAALASAYRGGRLNDLVAGTNLPEVAPPAARRLQIVAVDPAGDESPAAVVVAELVDDERECGCGGRHAVCPVEQSSVSPARAALEGLLDTVAARYDVPDAPAGDEPFDAGDWGAPSHAPGPWG